MRVALTLPAGLRHAFGVAQRVIAALFAGYGISVLASIGLVVALPLARTEAIIAAAMLGFLLHACVALWAFAAATLTRMWIGLALLAAPLALLAWQA